MLFQKLIGGSVPPAIVTYVTNVSNSSNLTTYTLTSVSIGTASADRYVIVGFGASDGTAGKTDSSVTIGGVSATKLVGAYYVGGTTRMCAMYAALVPTGTTATVAITFSGQMSRLGVSVFSSTGLQSVTPRDSATAQGDTSGTLLSASLTGPDGGFIVGFVFMQDELANFVWTGITERNDTALENLARYSGASDNFTVGGAKSVSVSTTQTDQFAVCAVYMR